MPSTPVVVAPGSGKINDLAPERKRVIREGASATRPAQLEMKIVTQPEHQDANATGGTVQKLFYESTPLGNTEIVSDRAAGREGRRPVRTSAPGAHSSRTSRAVVSATRGLPAGT